MGIGRMVEHSEVRKIIPGLVWYRPLEPFAYSFIRFCTGAFVVLHGAYRLFYGGSVAELGALAQLPASAIGTFELVGGAMLAVGLLTRPIALLLVIEWLCIAVAVPLRPGASYLMLGATPHYPAMAAAFCFAFMLRGGGYCSLDRFIGKEV
jgi:putative oxidoreductase